MQAHYQDGAEEADRLAGWSLERLRTEELLARWLPAPPSSVLDAGGGPGRYAAWLAGLGHRVTLLDPVPVHVEAAAARPEPIGVERADAVALPHPAAAFDAVLLLGPLYHLVEPADRAAALAEAARVVRPGGVVVAAGICRFAALLDGFVNRFHLDERFRAIAAATTATGRHRNPDGRPEWFTTAYFHRPAELGEELRAAGLAGVEVLGVEGPAWVFGDRGREPDDERWRDAALWAARAVEAEPEAVALSAHLLAVGWRR
jgi:SAM-dependent methyltransferase